MSTVAEQLRAAREAKKLTVEQIAESTKIRTDHIRALEEGNFSVFSAPIAPVTARGSNAAAYDTTDPRSIKNMSTSEWIEAERNRQIKKLEALRNR